MKNKIYLILKVLGGAVFVLSLSLNYVFYKADIEYELAYRRILKIESTPSPILNSIEDFHEQLIKGSFEYLNNNNRIELPQFEHVSFRIRLNNQNLKSKLEDNIYYDHDGYLLLSLLNDAIKSNNKKRIDYLKEYFDNYILQKPIICTPQSVVGMVSLLLYRHTNDVKYKNYSEDIYLWLKNRNTEKGILYIEGMSTSLVDGIGMIVPFLVEYSKVFNCVEAYKLALFQIEIYTKYGCDKETGMPSFAYRIEAPHVKVGRMNWGRGVSWFVIGLSYIETTKLSEECQETIRRLNMTLGKIWKRDHRFDHFICDNVIERDLSAELPIIYYLNKIGYIQLSEREILEYSQFMHDGIMYHCSNGNSGAIEYGVAHGPILLAQAFMLRLTRKTNDGN